MATVDFRVGEHDRTQVADKAGLPHHVVERLHGVFREHPSVEEVTLYGSRAKGNFRPASDIDLSLHGREISWEAFQAIEREIDDLLLPWKVDLSLYQQIDNDDLKEHIARVGIRFWKCSRLR